MDLKDSKDTNGSAAEQLATIGGSSGKRSSNTTSQQLSTNGNQTSSAISTTIGIISSKSLHLNDKSATNKPSSLKDSHQGKENQADIFHSRENHEATAREESSRCFECNRSLAKSRHLINLAGQMHKWHPECFKCTVCNHPLDREASCHVYKDKIVCREDYAKLRSDNSIKCSRCRWPIEASDWVRKAGQYVYHLACFSCDICLRQLSTGEQFTMSIQEEKSIVHLLCRLHFAIKGGVGGGASGSQQQQQQEHAQSFAHQRAPAFKKFQQEHYHQYLHLLASSSTSGSQTLLLDSSNAASSAGRKCQSQDFDSETLGLQLSDEAQHAAIAAAQRASATSTGSSSNASTSGGGGGGGGSSLTGIQSKSKRVRTTFTEDQLSILQTHFQIDSNPDGQDLERIATITGLSKRVTQVWFQNSRARQKKYMIKRKPSGSAAAAVAAVASTIGLAGSSSSGLVNTTAGGASPSRLSSFGSHHQQHQIQRVSGTGSGANSNGANRLQGIGMASGSTSICFPQNKWSDERMSDRSDTSLDGCATNGEDDDDLVDDVEDIRSSSSSATSSSSSSSSSAVAAPDNPLMRRGSSGEVDSPDEQ